MHFAGGVGLRLRNSHRLLREVHGNDALRRVCDERGPVARAAGDFENLFPAQGGGNHLAQERKIGLSIRAMKDDQFRSDWEAYQENEGTGTATLGDHFRNR